MCCEHYLSPMHISIHLHKHLSSVHYFAGTGKTESVKALASCLGRQVLVFNCDEALERYVRHT